MDQRVRLERNSASTPSRLESSAMPLRSPSSSALRKASRFWCMRYERRSTASTPARTTSSTLG